ncbi:enoyl-CoA hydratase/isomerase family protein [Rhodomicrobium vannielii ATCC 17100]|uniref:3-hydroxyacyl-CoA dehydrogenase NAD-binding domain-containing protein n=1 Tax=Rhodomicrobium vannielii TaxID=1069 RepID=UPI001919C8CC|nr:3-hydroxyacyl-CoA dehydrogenase NAD-binding domain-containing protein [Rhodomicrobium vannielii]MBJ7534473.1 enoyl-CoA hydratase/isomerase family protein [Rhodomicrobium vannielii ATCC 17100]
MSSISYQVDADGIATLTIDQPGKSMNVISPEFTEELSEAIERAAADTSVKGIVITSGKSSFVAGADLIGMSAMIEHARNAPAAEALKVSSRLTEVLRRIETIGKPVATAINGTALGGGFEIALATHYRVAADDESIKIGQPEVQVGLLPGAGGTQRIPRLIGIMASAPLLLEGKHLSPAQAKSSGLIHDVVPAAELLAKAKAWLLSPQAKSVQPWDERGFKVPGGAGGMHPAAAQLFMAANAMTRDKTLGNYPAAQAILSAVYEGTQVPIDLGLKIEAKYFLSLLRGPVAPAMIRTLFVNKGRADKLVRRPQGVPKAKFRKVGMLGAGMMGAAIAYVAASNGIEVVLLDRDVEAAERGKGYARKLVEKAVSRRKMAEVEGEALLARIQATADYADLADVDYIIEAVFEDRAIKADVTKKVEAVIRPDVIFGSNTSTIPITSLAEASERPEQFIGIHFFSPAEKMPLVEIIRGNKTSDEALAVTLDFVQGIRKTPIVVNDGRGFFTSRFCMNYIGEGEIMLTEGIPAALVENAGKLAGMPVGPLALADETAIDLGWKIHKAAETDLGDAYKPSAAIGVMEAMYVKNGRAGRKNGKGFYDYPEGGQKMLWAGLAELFPVKPESEWPSIDDLKKRLLFAQALDAVRTMEDGVLTDPEDGDVGGIFGLGFAPYTGGPLSMLDGIGIANVVAECERLAANYGERFSPPKLLRDMAVEGRTFYPAAKAAA